jgi:hypothetical protein
MNADGRVGVTADVDLGRQAVVSTLVAIGLSSAGCSSRGKARLVVLAARTRARPQPSPRYLLPRGAGSGSTPAPEPPDGSAGEPPPV